MGIPSFYRQLCRGYSTLIAKGVGPPPEWLCLDFNCAMYFVLNQMPPLSDFSDVAVWEEKLCRNIAAYMGELCELAAPTKGVYVSCDGVVCAAKRRQQRLRRFKGPWASIMEARSSGVVKEAGWDQNALTPGSAFMARLGEALISAGATLAKRRGISVIVSTTREAGEGEHKLLAHMRLVKPATCTIYGLDADLILLAMLLDADVRLMREAQEFESSKNEGAGGWRSLSISGLVAVMIPENGRDSKIRDFVCAMSLLGNDFLPRSLTHTVRNDGIPLLIKTLTTRVWSADLTLVGGDGLISRAGLLALLIPWAEQEERNLEVAAWTANRASGRSGDEWNNLPSQWASAGRLLHWSGSGLAEGWRGIYQAWKPGDPANYVAGVAWIWDYYSGRPVDQAWMFDEHLPPLWSDVVAHLRGSGSEHVVPAPRIQYPLPLSEKTHLLAVLPADSVRRLLPAVHQRLMGQMPWFWPDSWSVFDVGKTQMWECEPVIPMIPESVLRKFDAVSVGGI